jgi:hypothetical protein
MPARLVRWRLAAVVAALVLAITAWLAWPHVTSAALLLDLADPASRLRAWLPVRVDAARTTDLNVPTRYGAIAARLYTPTSPTHRTLVVFPGVHAGGVDEPRLAALAARLAGSGAAVLTVPLPDLRAYRIAPNATDQMEDAIGWAAGRADLAPEGRVGVIGVSFAGGLALVATGRPGLRGRLTSVVSLGGHADLPRAMAYSCTGRLPDGTVRPPHDYGVVLALLAGIPRLVPSDQVAGLDRAVVTFLDASSYASLDQARSASLFGEARRRADTLPEPSRTLMHWVNARETGRIGERVLPFVEELGGHSALSPERSPATDAPVFALHGLLDNVIPSTETPQLVAYLSRAGNAQVRSLLTPLVSHAEMLSDFRIGDAWRLTTFWTSVWKGLLR